MQHWFPNELAELRSSPIANLTIYVTGSLGSSSASSTHEKQSSKQIVDRIPDFEKSDICVSDPEKDASGHCSPSSPDSVQSLVLGRPEISASIRDIVSATTEEEGTIVAACGPESLMKETRATVGDLVASSGRSVTLHCEQFGW